MLGLKFRVVINQAASETLRPRASSDAVNPPGMVGSRVDQVDESQLRQSEETLEFRCVDRIPLNNVHTNVTVDIISKFKTIGKWIIARFPRYQLRSFGSRAGIHGLSRTLFP